jgi:hypothetical protein
MIIFYARVGGVGGSEGPGGGEEVDIGRSLFVKIMARVKHLYFAVRGHPFAAENRIRNHLKTTTRLKGG